MQLNLFKEEIIRGNITYLSKAITLAESTRSDHQDFVQTLIKELNPYRKKSKRIAVTGIPGVGKSTFIEALGKHIVKRKQQLAVLAIDPSSSLSKGSILGDKTRMEDLAREELAYIRPSANNGTLGGITARTYESILLCEAAGFDNILIETVGVGQSEVLVSSMTDLFLFLQLPGSGDDLQGIKRGIMEMADIIFVNKIDVFEEKMYKDAKLDIVRSLQFLPTKNSQWKRKIIMGSGLKGNGVAELWDLIEDYFAHIEANRYYEKNRAAQHKAQSINYIHELALNKIKKQLLDNPFVEDNSKTAFEDAKEWFDKFN
ncbi:methylmalonyl Co-A mutase-associated GTPase MeaB [Vaginella massiliensis]|uniref:methylmalonyl Co-A mutase-associated GTPase MeaB n=1 Tax=Vaginella massiliensis TaxID=1816680 RepID=UPI0008397EEC|nr:methylmalonyl Co-A mutase-associated GTPase MeaB [Vaginella massiliensis]